MQNGAKLDVVCLTVFRVEKLLCVGGTSSSSPYQVTPEVGRILGVMGQVRTPRQEQE